MMHYTQYIAILLLSLQKNYNKCLLNPDKTFFWYFEIGITISGGTKGALIPLYYLSVKLNKTNEYGLKENI